MNDIYIIQCGAQTPVGSEAAVSAASVRASISRLMRHPKFEDERWEPVTVGMATYIDEDCAYKERIQKLCLPALKEAVAPLLNIQDKLETIPLIIGLPEQRPSLPEDIRPSILESISTLESETCLSFMTEFISLGHASGLIALEKAVEIMDKEEAQFCLFGGVDSYIEESTLSWLEDSRRLLCSNNQNGFIPGEAAGFCLLSLQKIADNYKIPKLAKILGVASSEEELSYESQKICTGRGLMQSVSKVLSELPTNRKVNKIYSTLNGERYYNTEYGNALPKLSQYVENAMDFIAPVDCWGDIGAASGPLLACLATESGKRGYASGTYSLILTSSLGKSRAAALLEINITKRRKRTWEK